MYVDVYLSMYCMCMSMYMYVGVCVSLYVLTFVHVYVYVHVCRCVSLYVLYVYVYVHVCRCVFSLSLCTDMCMYMYVGVCLSMYCMCMYMYVDVCLSLYVLTCVCTCHSTEHFPYLSIQAQLVSRPVFGLYGESIQLSRLIDLIGPLDHVILGTNTMKY